MQFRPWLFWLEWRLLWRGSRRSMSAAVGAILAILIYRQAALGIAVGCVFGFRALAMPNDEQLLRGATTLE